MSLLGKAFLLNQNSLSGYVSQIKAGFVAKNGEHTAENLKSQCIKKIGNIAVLQVWGPLVTGDSFLSMLKGSISYGSIKSVLDEFIKDNDTKAVLIDWDSPGGDIHGCAELAEYVKNYEKPIYSYITGESCSASYWIAASTRNIIGYRTSLTGSIGVIAVVEEDDDEIAVTSNYSPNKVLDLKSDDGKNRLIDILDHTTNLFIDDVAKYRNTDKNNVIENYGKGNVVVAENALKLGMIDQIGNFDFAIDYVKSQMDSLLKNNSVTGKNRVNKLKGVRFMGKINMKAELVLVNSEDAGEIDYITIDVDTIKENFPDIAKALINEGMDKQKDMSSEVESVVAEADMENDGEKEVAAMARMGKISAEQAREMLAIAKKSKESQLEKDNNPERLRAEDNIEMPNTSEQGGNEKVPKSILANAIARRRGKIGA